MSTDVRTTLHTDLPLGEVIEFPPTWNSPGVVPTPAALRTTPASPAWERAKRTFDVAVSATALVVLSPLLLLSALAIRLDTPGPVLFRQERYGRNRKPFTVLKFRSMHDGVSPEAHRRYIEQLATNEAEVGPGLKKLTGDPRVTRVGAFLRRWSIDELPQLINVVRGEMSIIGPRSALAYELKHYDAEHFERFDVRPGLTGLWQVSGRNQIGFRGMLDLDAEYARTNTLRVDAKILLRTPRALLRSNAA
jgi:lipopolysaccharide/colanic/teichoic acid biosynthesis glycosyltransferase